MTQIVNKISSAAVVCIILHPGFQTVRLDPCVHSCNTDLATMIIVLQDRKCNLLYLAGHLSPTPPTKEKSESDDGSV